MSWCSSDGTEHSTYKYKQYGILTKLNRVSLLRFYALTTQPIIKFCMNVVRGIEKDRLLLVFIFCFFIPR